MNKVRAAMHFLLWLSGGTVAAVILHYGLGVGCVVTATIAYGLGWVVGWASLAE